MKKNTLLHLISALAGLSLFLSACGALPAAKPAAQETQVPPVNEGASFHAEGKVVPQAYTTLSFNSVGGEIGTISVKEGQLVKKGDVLVELTKTEALQSALAGAQQAEVNARKALDDLNNKSDLDRENALAAWREAEKDLLKVETILNDLDDKQWQDKLGDREDDVKDAWDDLDDAKEKLDKYQDLDPTSSKRKDAQDDYNEKLQKYNEKVFIRDQWKNDLDLAKANVEAAKSKVADAKREYNNRVVGVDPDTRAKAEAALDAAKAQVASAQRALDNAVITAPFDGTVTDLFHLAVGAEVNPGQSIIQVADLSTLYAETKDLTELDVVKIKEGDPVELTADAFPGKTMEGTIESIKQVYGEYSGDVVYTVRVKLTQPEAGIRWGMTVDAVFTQDGK